MRLSGRKLLQLSLILGIITTLISAFRTVDLTHGEGATILGYGSPLSWLQKTTIVYPGSPTTWDVLWPGLFADVIIWFFAMAGMLYIIGKLVIILAEWKPGSYHRWIFRLPAHRCSSTMVTGGLPVETEGLPLGGLSSTCPTDAFNLW